MPDVLGSTNIKKISDVRRKWAMCYTKKGLSFNKVLILVERKIRRLT